MASPLTALMLREECREEKGEKPRGRAVKKRSKSRVPVCERQREERETEIEIGETREGTHTAEAH